LEDPELQADLEKEIRRVGENTLKYLKDKSAVCDLDKEERLLEESIRKTLDKWD